MIAIIGAEILTALGRRWLRLMVDVSVSLLWLGGLGMWWKSESGTRAVAFVGLSDGCDRMDCDGRMDGCGWWGDEKEISCLLARGVRRKFTKQNRPKEKK